jgi:hypothetical protein
MDQSERLVVGVAWYRENQWDRLKEVSADRDRLEDAWTDWVRGAEASMRDVRAQGIDVRKVDVDVEELLRWCRANGKPVNGESRSSFAAKKLLDREPERGGKPKRKRG